MIVVMLDANGDPIKRQVTCPDCISVLALVDASMGVVVLQNAHVGTVRINRLARARAEH